MISPVEQSLQVNSFFLIIFNIEDPYHLFNFVCHNSFLDQRSEGDARTIPAQLKLLYASTTDTDPRSIASGKSVLLRNTIDQGSI